MRPGLVSILIVNWNTREAILRCLDAIPAGADGALTYEVIVVDNGSVDGSTEALQERTDIELIGNRENRGFAAAVNQAYARSSGELILLLNSDVDLTAGSLRVLTQFLHENPRVAGVGPLYLNPDGSPQPFHFRLPTLSALLANGSVLFRRFMPGSTRILRDYRVLDDDFSAPLRVQQPSASCLLLRRACLPEDSVLDERYPIFFNDVMLARRMFERDQELWVTPDSVVVHEAHSSTRQLGEASRRQYLASVVRMLEDTESPLKVWTYRAVIFSQNLVLWIGGRDSLRGADLWRTLAGDPGPLPAHPSARPGADRSRRLPDGDHASSSEPFSRSTG